MATGRELTCGNRDLEFAMAKGPIRARDSAGKWEPIGLESPMEDSKIRTQKPERKRTKPTGKWWGDAKRKSVAEGLEKAANPTREPD